MGINTLEKLTDGNIHFYFRKELSSCSKNGVIHFQHSNYNATNTCWNGESLTIPAYGIYKISWGFKQGALDTFYKDDVTELSLLIDHNKYESAAIITKDTPCYYAMKSSCKSTIMLLRENQNISFHAEIINKKNPKMKDIYFNILKLETV